MSSDRLAGRTIWITGAASGLGKASALRCAEAGAGLILTDLKAPDELAAHIGAQAQAFAQDVTDEESWDRIADAAGAFHVLVNNAGVGENRALAETSLAQWRRVLDVNLDAVFLGTRLAFRRMKPGGSVINVSSVLGMVGNVGTAHYGASKGGVRLLTKHAAVEAAQTGLGIRVNSIHPGYIETPMVIDAVNRQPAPDQIRAHIAGRHPVGHLGEPDDIAHAVVYLASNESKFVTGTETVVDGGYTAW
ncbi:SDR family oxidoreductase [Minwuia sp.]|uniref:SDR family oxidoreductase n=1 Tax=Minwuia sp. TaxID=2493630 RepID=UPI003A913AB8